MRFAWALVAAAGCAGTIDNGGGGADAPVVPPDIQLGALKTADTVLMVCTGGAPGTATCMLNEIALDDLGGGTGIPGAKFSFIMQRANPGILLSNMRFIPGATGLHIEHPTFVSVDAAAKQLPDPLDRFATISLDVATAATPDQQKLGSGDASFPQFSDANKLAVFFTVARAL